MTEKEKKFLRNPARNICIENDWHLATCIDAFMEDFELSRDEAEDFAEYVFDYFGN